MRSSSLDMEATRSGLIAVPVTINGTPQNMIVSPNAFMGDVSQKLVDTLDLKVLALKDANSTNPAFRYGPIYFGNGEHAKGVTRIASVVVGMENIAYTEFLINPYRPDEDGKIAGALGYDVWQHFDLDFDFANGKLNLFSPDHCPGKVVYWAGSYTDADTRSAGGGGIGVTMSLDGHDVDSTLDVASPVTTMTLTAARTAFGIDENSPGVEKLTQDGGTIYRTHFKALTLSGITVNNPEVYLIPDAVAETARKDLQEDKMNGYEGRDSISSPHLVVGLNVLRHLHLYVAYKEHKIYVTAADAH